MPVLSTSRWLLVAIVIGWAALATEGVDACMRGGISGEATAAIIGLCVVFSPVLLVAGAGYATGSAVAAAGHQVKSHIKDAMDRRKTQKASNLFLRQRNNYVRKIGSEVFNRYIADVHQKMRENPGSASALVEFGAAMLLNHDLLAASDAFNAAIKIIEASELTARSRLAVGLSSTRPLLNNELSPVTWTPPAATGAATWDPSQSPLLLEELQRAASAYFTRGFILQLLGRYGAASDDMDWAVSHLYALRLLKKQRPAEATPNPPGVVPTLALADAVNGCAFVHYLAAAYPSTHRDTAPESTHCPGIAELLGWVAPTAHAMIEAAYTKAIELDPTQGMYYHNRALYYYYVVGVPQLVNPAATEDANADATLGDIFDPSGGISKALADWDAAIATHNFGTEAEGHAFRAQCLALLQRPQEAQSAQERAAALSDDVFLVSLNKYGELTTPWPLPIETYRGHMDPHSWAEHRFLKPTWCDVCMQRISLRASGAKLYECGRCRMKACHRCREQVEASYCVVSAELVYKVGDRVSCPTISATKIFTVASVGYTVSLTDPTSGKVLENIFPTMLIPALPAPSTGSGAAAAPPSAAPLLPSQHMHTLKPRSNHRPKHCGACDKFIFSHHTYRCDKCPYTCHVDCVPTDGTALVVEAYPSA